jgi:hypothetical protein
MAKLIRSTGTDLRYCRPSRTAPRDRGPGGRRLSSAGRISSRQTSTARYEAASMVKHQP